MRNPERAVLPRSWTWTTLGDICDKPKYGWTTRASQQSDHFKFLRTTDISRGAIDWNSVPHCDQDPDRPDQYLLHQGDIVISRAGSIGLSSLIGNCPPAVFASYLIRFRPSTEVDPKFVSYFLQSPSYWDQVAASAAGIALQNVNAKKLAAISLPLPPQPEQQRIVAAIEEQFTRLDAAVAGLKRTQANLKRYRAAVLAAACSGRLVPTEAELARQEGRDYEPADHLLQRILIARRERWEADQLAKLQVQGKVPKGDAWKGKYVEADLPDSRVDVPVGWCTCTLGHLALASDGMITGPFGTLISKDDYRDSGIPISGIPNISRSGYVDEYSTFLSPEKAGSLEKYFIRSGDLIVSRSGTVGEICVVPELHDIAVMSTNLMRIRVVPSDLPSQWLIINFKGNLALQAQIDDLCKGSTRAFLNLGILSSLEIPIPPIAELNRIVTEVEHNTSVIDELERSTQHALIRAERLRQSILRRAFEGTLVPQDPTDEPADVLLERIQAERAATAPNGRQRKPRARKSTQQPLFDLQEVGETE